jgi:hypothetical protein
MRRIIQLFGKIISPAASRFQQALRHPQRTQKLVQREIIARLINSTYGQALGINSIADWQRVPCVDYEDMIPWLKPTVQKDKYQKIPLTPEPILFFEKTSGSSGAMKLIPYTQSLRRSFNQMFCVWANDLIVNGPDFSTGKIYACISPKLNEADGQTLENDLDYLDTWLRYFLRPWLVLPDQLNNLTDVAAFKHQLALALLKAEDLEIISIWSPTFLQVHLKYIQENQHFLQAELQQKISLNRLKILQENPIPWELIWPNLKLISCWDSANAADQAQGLRSQFPKVLVQGKGLLATEAPLTIPLIKARGYVPVLDEVFFEFENDQGVILSLTELTIGQEYRLILSQKGGLYRYRIGDRICVTHYYQNTPCLEFLGRYQSVSDLVGEKLSETFVNNAVARLNLSSSNFKSLVPVAAPPHYLLLLDRAEEAPALIAQKLDSILSESYHYQRARQLGQLEAPEVFISEQIPELLISYHIRAGSIWGGIKHPVLAKSPPNTELLEYLRKMYNDRKCS